MNPVIVSNNKWATGTLIVSNNKWATGMLIVSNNKWATGTLIVSDFNPKSRFIGHRVVYNLLVHLINLTV